MWGLAWKPDPESRGARVVAFEGKDVEAPVHCSLMSCNVTEPQMTRQCRHGMMNWRVLPACPYSGGDRMLQAALLACRDFAQSITLIARQ